MSDAPDILNLSVSHPRLDAAAAPDFKRELAETVPAGHTRVLIDLDAVEFIDSTGLGVLVALLKQMGPNGRVAVVGVKPAVARLFQITRLDSLFRLCGDAEEARQVLAA